jgi:DnaK suppressor protein
MPAKKTAKKTSARAARKTAKKKIAGAAKKTTKKKVTKAAKKTAKKKVTRAAKKTTKKKVSGITRKKSRPPSPKVALKRILLTKREELREEVSRYIKGDSRQLMEAVFDDGDWSVIDLAEGINLRHLSAQRQILQKIEQALRKLDNNTYGICEECEKKINPKRLKVMPFAVLCRDCKEKSEELEAVAEEETGFK